MLLILTNSQDATADYLEPILRDKGIPTVRLNTDQIISHLSFTYKNNRFSLNFEERVIPSSEITNIWYRRPKRLDNQNLDDSAENKYIIDEWAETLENYLSTIPNHKWMNHPADNSYASRKILQLEVCSDFGICSPDTIVTQDPDEIRSFHDENPSGVIVKPLSTGYVETEDDNGRDKLIYTNKISKSDLEELDDLKKCPTLFQELIEKKYDVRVTVVDKNIHAVKLENMDDNNKCDIRRDNMENVKYEPIKLPRNVRSGILKLIDFYNLRFSAIDLAVTQEEKWYFFEINPNGQWAWLDIETNVNIAESFVESFS